MDRAQKETVVEELGQIFKVSGVIVIAHYTGLSVAEMSDLRLRMKNAGGSVRVAKNRLAKIALHKTQCESIEKLFSGQTVIIHSEDQVAAAKVAVGFSKENEKLAILGGSMGSTILDSKAVTEVSKMPSREEVIASISALVVAPASNLSLTIGSPASSIAGILSSIEDRKAA